MKTLSFKDYFTILAKILHITVPERNSKYCYWQCHVYTISGGTPHVVEYRSTTYYLNHRTFENGRLSMENNVLC